MEILLKSVQKKFVSEKGRELEVLKKVGETINNEEFADYDYHDMIVLGDKEWKRRRFLRFRRFSKMFFDICCFFEISLKMQGLLSKIFEISKIFKDFLRYLLFFEIS